MKNPRIAEAPTLVQTAGWTAMRLAQASLLFGGWWLAALVVSLVFTLGPFDGPIANASLLAALGVVPFALAWWWLRRERAKRHGDAHRQLPIGLQQAFFALCCGVFGPGCAFLLVRVLLVEVRPQTIVWLVLSLVVSTVPFWVALAALQPPRR